VIGQVPSFTVYLVTLLLLFLLVAAGLCIYFSVFAYMKQYHHSQWTELGRPSPTHNTIASNFRCWRYIFSRKYRSSGDPVLIRRCDVLLVYSLIVIVVFALISVFLKPARFSI